MIKRLVLLLKTKVEGYYTQAGTYVPLHYDKRPSAKPKPTTPERPAAAAPSEVPQLGLFSILDKPRRTKPKAATPSLSKPEEKEEVAPSKPAEDQENSRSVNEKDEPFDKPPESASPKEEKPRKTKKIDQSKNLNYSQPFEKLLEALPEFGAQPDWTPSKRKKANTAALEELSERNPDRSILAKYSGQGGVGDSLNEYYTPTPVAAAMWNVLARLGLKTGHVLEPSAGTGVFQETKPQGIQMTAVEYDETSSSINQALHPDDQVVNLPLEGFVTAIPEKYDAVIGNPPFGLRGDLVAQDKPELGAAEEYFLDTALDKTKDGGAVCMVIPHGIATNPSSRSFRQRLLAKSEVLACHRMPNSAFAHAGTGVVTDILVLRKRAQDVAGALGQLEKKDLQGLGVWDQAWMDGKILDDPRGAVHGTVGTNWRGGLDVTGSMEGIPQALATMPISPERSDLTLDQVLDHIKDRPDLAKKVQGAARRNPYPDLPIGTTKMINGVLYILQGEPRRWHRAQDIGPGVQYTPESKEGTALDLAERIKNAADFSQKGTPVNVAALREEVLAYVQQYGIPAGDKVLGAMAQRDPRFLPLLAAVDGNGKLSPLLEGKVNTAEAAGLDTTDFDAVMKHLLAGDGRQFTVEDIGVNWTGARGKTAEEIANEIRQRLYASDQYAVSLDGKFWGSREDLLAGDLYPKRDAMASLIPRLETANPVRHKLEQQVAWLNETLAPKSIEDVEISLRSGWIPTEVLADYLNTRLSKFGDQTRPATVKVEFKDSIYSIIIKGNGWLDKIYDKYLNRLRMTEEDWKKIPDLEQEFAAWVATSPHRSAVEDLYNRLYNGYRPKRYGDATVEIPGWNPERSLNGYQHPMVRWSVEEGKGIIAYDVGLGKTAGSLAIIKTLKQRGEAKRAVIVVPKSVDANWLSEIDAFLPGSNVLIIGETFTKGKDGKMKGRPDTKAERDTKLHQLIQGSYDFVLMTQPAFNDIQLDPLVRGQYVEEDFWVKRGDKLDEAGSRHMNEIRTAYKQAMAEKDFRKRTNAIYWNDLGVDCLVCDEAHGYKNLFEARGRQGGTPKYLGGSGFAKRALDMQHKSRYVREHNHNRGVYFLTATPTKNSPLEVYSMLNHIAPEIFVQRGIRNQEEFIDRYVEMDQRQVLDTDNTVQTMSVVTGFKNMNELRSIMGRYIYRKTAEDVGLQLPEKQIHEHYVEMTPQQQAVYAELREALENADAKSTGDAHIFSVMNKMQKAAMDLGLLDGEDDPSIVSPKYNEAVKTITEGLTRGGQVVFADNLLVHQAIRNRLIAAGVPAEQIGIINADVAKDGAARHSVADDYVNGILKVVIGNTATMGEGVNLQKFTSDIHHLDLPWEPASLQQRNGRGIRQGNKLAAVGVHTYLAKKSFDGYRYQTIAGKRTWQDQLWHGADRIENLAQEQGTLSREDFMIMMSEDPDKARAEFEKNRDAQMQKYQAVKKHEASTTFMRLQRYKKNYAALPNKDTQSAQQLAYRIQRLREELSKNEHFPQKELLDTDKTTLMTSAGVGLYEGSTVQVAKDATSPIRGASDADRWVVTSLDFDKNTVRMRPVGVFPETHYEDPTTEFELKDLSAGLTPVEPINLRDELQEAIPNLRLPSHLTVYPPAIVQSLEPQIQAHLRKQLSSDKDGSALWTRTEYGGVAKLYSRDSAAARANFLLPTEETADWLTRKAVEEEKRYGPSYGRSDERHFRDAMQEVFGYTRARDMIIAAKEAPTIIPRQTETGTQAAVYAKSGVGLLLFGKSFPGHRGRMGQRGGSQPMRAPDTGKGSDEPGWEIDLKGLSTQELMVHIENLRGSRYETQALTARKEFIRRMREEHGASDQKIASGLTANRWIKDRPRIAKEWAPAMGITEKEFARLAQWVLKAMVMFRRLPRIVDASVRQ